MLNIQTMSNWDKNKNTKKRKKLVVYADQGAAHSGLSPVLRESFRNAAISAEKANTIKLGKALNEDVLAFFLPGIIGHDSPYKEQLGKIGNQKIREYVEAGGVFVGLCAGAYYACNDIIYNPPWLNPAKTSQPGLNFFNALAKGPLVNHAIEDGQHWYSDCTITNISYKDQENNVKSSGIVYGNGPAMFPHSHHENIEVIARYEDEEDTPIAIAVTKVGKGLAFFIGVLPQYQYQETNEARGLEGLRNLMQNIKVHESGRQDVWNLIVSRIKKHNADLGRVELYPELK